MADDTAQKLLLSYVSIIAERNGRGPGSGFEFDLFDAVGSDEPSDLISQEQREELRFLVDKTNMWVTYDFETRMFALIDAFEWIKLRVHE